MYPALAVMPNSRFVAITSVGPFMTPPPLSSPSVVTVREPLAGGTSIVEGWKTDGGSTPVQSRSFSWATTLHVEAVAGNSTGFLAVGGRTTNTVAVEVMSPTGFGTSGYTTLEPIDGGVPTMTRLRALEVGVAPAVAWVQGGGQPNLARLYRVATPVMLTHVHAAGMLGQSFGDDLIESPLPRPMPTGPRLLMTARCNDICTFTGAFTSNYGLAHRYAWFPYDVGTPAMGTAVTYQAVLDPGGSAPVFFGGRQVRLAADNNLFVYLAGQSPSGELLIERRHAGMGTRDFLFASTGVLTLADIITAPSPDPAVLVLANYTDGGVAFGGGLPQNGSNLGNIVILKISAANGVIASSFDIPGDQQAVAFTYAGEGFLFVAVNQGSDAVLWRVPAP